MNKNIIILLAAIFTMLIPASTLRAFETGDVQIHGFYSQGYLKTNHNNYLAETEEGSLQFDEFGVNFSAQLTDSLHAGLQLFGRDLGPVGNNEVRLDWAFLDYRWQDWLGVRIGKTKSTQGLYNEVRDLDMLRTSIMLPQSVYSELWRDSFATARGLTLYGVTPASVLGKLAYTVGVGVFDLDKDTGFASAFKDSLAQSSIFLNVESMDHRYMNSLAFTWYPPLDGLRLKYSFFDIKDFELTGTASIPAYGVSSTRILYEVPEFDGWTGSLEYMLGNLTLVGEYSKNDFKGRMDLGLGMGFQDRPPLPSEGWYVSTDYRFCDWFSAAVTYSSYFPNMNDTRGENEAVDFLAWLKTWTLSTRFDINSYWIVKFEASYNDGFGAYDSMSNVPADLDRYWMLYAVKATVHF